jgi:hypothetical protein
MFLNANIHGAQSFTPTDCQQSQAFDSMGKMGKIGKTEGETKATAI